MIKDSKYEIRLSSKDKLRMQALAQKAGLKDSEYVRQAILQDKIISLSKEEIAILRSLSNNLNQLTRYAHTTGLIVPEMNDLLASLVLKIQDAYCKR